MSRKAPTLETLRLLFARSGNNCAFPGCNRKLFNESNVYIAEICHIEGAEPGGERYNDKQTDDERRGFSNLILMCHDHHVITDDISVYTVDKLRKLKTEHEAKYSAGEFIVNDITLQTIIISFEQKITPIINAAMQPLIDIMKQVAQGVETLKVNSEISTNAPVGLQRLIQKIQTAEPAIKVEAHTTDKGTSFVIRPSSHEQSVNIAEISFPETESGRRGLEKFRSAIERGYDVEIDPDEHSWMPNINLPAALLGFSSIKPSLKIQPNAFLKKHSPPVPVSVVYYHGNTVQEICKFGFARLQVLRYGTKEIEFRLSGGQMGADFTFTHNFEDNQVGINFDLDLSRVKPIHALETLKLFEALENHSNIRMSIVSLDTDMPLIEGKVTTGSSALSLSSISHTKKILIEICEINRILNLELRYPMVPNAYLGMEVMLVYGLTIGKTVFAAAKETRIPFTINCKEAKELLTSWSQGKTVDFPSPEAPVFTIAGHKIEIPGASVVLRGSRPGGALEDFEARINACSNLDDRISFEIIVDQFVYYPPETAAPIPDAVDSASASTRTESDSTPKDHPRGK